MTEVPPSTAHEDADVSAGTHQALLYSTPEEFLTAAVGFVRAGLDRGDEILVATPRSAELSAALGLTAADPVEVVDDRSWHQFPARTIGSFARRAQRSAVRGGRLRALCELRWKPDDRGLPGEGSGEREPGERAGTVTNTEWHRYESILNSVLTGLPIDLCCPYDQGALDARILSAARCTHPTLLHATGESTGNPGPLLDWDGSPTYLAPPDYLTNNPAPAEPPVPSDALTIRFGAADIPAVRRTALNWALAAGMDQDSAQELLIAVYEVVSNAVEHGGGIGIGRFWSHGSTLYCDVWSARPILDPVAGYRPPTADQERGRGLWLARQICERVTIHNGTGPDGAPTGGATVRLTTTVR